jgi:hypothetical protein
MGNKTARLNNTPTNIIAKQTSKGEATIRIGQYCGDPVIWFDLAGRNISCWGCSPTLIETLKTPITTKSGELCHHKIGPLPLTDSETETLRAAVIAAKEEHEATPEAKTEKLRNQRRDLACGVAGAVDDLGAHRERCYRQDTGFYGMAPFEARIISAQKALAEFDAAHPEMIVEIKAEQAEATARNMWN